jgi:iron complex outermembrane receptor protein
VLAAVLFASRWVRLRTSHINMIRSRHLLHTASDAATASPSAHLGAQALYYDKQGKTAANELPTDSFTLVDVDASYRVPMGPASVFLFLCGSSLLDEDARQHSSPLKDIAPLPG